MNKMFLRIEDHKVEQDALEEAQAFAEEVNKMGLTDSAEKHQKERERMEAIRIANANGSNVAHTRPCTIDA